MLKFDASAPSNHEQSPTGKWMSWRGMTPTTTGFNGLPHMGLPIAKDRTHESDPIDRRGFALGLNLNMWPQQADFGPRTLDPASSSWALLPPQMTAAGGQYLSRTTLGGVHDLLTGAPLIQDRDLDLPFGGATFRLIRTYSEPQSIWTTPYMREINQQYSVWDWAGTGWMINVSPVLLIDAAFSDVQGADYVAPEDAYRAPIRRCWFVPDAHHSIPFDFLPDKPGASFTEGAEYQAPYNIDARLTHNGLWDNGKRRWDRVPTEYFVHVLGGKVRYRIVPLRYPDEGPFEDIPEVEMETGTRDDWNRPIVDLYDPHEPPQFLMGQTGGTRRTNAGYGTPGMGLTTQIEDDFGHRVEIEIERTLRETVLDNPVTGTVAHDTPNPANVPARSRIEYTQNANEKGQVKSVRLIYQPPGASATVEWMLAFTYRNFYAWEYPLLAEYAQGQVITRNRWQEAGTMAAFLPTMLHSVHAYRAPTQTVVNQVLDRTSCTLDGRTFVEGRKTLGDVEDGVTVPNLPAGWEHEVRYYYNEVGKLNCLNPDGNENFDSGHINQWVSLGKYIDPNGYSRFGLEQLTPDGDTYRSILRRMGQSDEARSGLLRSGSPVEGYNGALPGGSFTPVLLMTTRRSGTGTPVERDRNLYWYRAGGDIPKSTDVTYTEHRAVRLAGLMRSESIKRAMAGFGHVPEEFDEPRHPSHLLELCLSDRLNWRDPATNQAPAQAPQLWEFADLLTAGRSVVSGSGQDLYNFLQSQYNGQYIPTFLGVPCRVPGSSPSDPAPRVLYYGNTEQGYDGIALRDGPSKPLQKFRIYSFLVPPSGVTVPDGSNQYSMPVITTDTENFSAQAWREFYPQDSIFHRPYRWVAHHLQDPAYSTPAGNVCYQWHTTSETLHAENNPPPSVPAALYPVTTTDGDPLLSNPSFITVVDEIDRAEGVETVAAFGAQSTLGISNLPQPKVQRRRVLWFNRAGYLIREKTYGADENGVLQPTGQTGAGEDYVYDLQGRLIEHRGVSYSAAAEIAQTATATEGQVKVFKYPSGDGPESRFVIGEGVQRGGSVISFSLSGTPPVLTQTFNYGATIWTHEMDRDTTDPSKVTVNRVYPQGRLNSESPSAVQKLETTTTYVYQPSPRNKQLALTKRVEPGQKVTESGPDVYPVSVESFDDRGRSVWKGSGYTSSASSAPGTSDLFMWAYWAYDTRGREIVRVADVADGTLTVTRGDGSGSVTVPSDRPLAWVRRGVSTAVNLTTQSYYGYDRLTRVDKPSGLRDYYFYIEGYPEETTILYKDIRPGTGGGAFSALSLGQITTQSGGQTVEGHEVRWTSASSEPTGTESYTEVRTIVPRYASDGSVSGAQVGSAAAQGQPAKMVEALQTTDQLGLVVREKAPSGDLTRYIRDGWGRTVKTYKGTDDTGWTDSGPPGSTTAQNMYLTERTVYGTGRTTVGGSTVWTPDIGQTVATYTYRAQPTTSTQLDTYGRIERNEFDLASRKVVTSVSSADGATAWTVLWLDLNERPRFTATYYGPRPTGAIGTLNQFSGAPAVSPIARFAEPLASNLADLILATSPASLEEKQYDARGNVTESRQYRCDSPWTSNRYVATKSIYDHNGKLKIQLSPGGGKQVTSYDDEGHPVNVWTGVGDVRQSRTDTTYIDGNAVSVVNWERVRTGYGDDLNSDNAIWTATYSWFDGKKRVIATADIGTGNPTDAYANAGAPPTWVGDVPSWSSSTGAYVHNAGSAWDVGSVSATTFARYTLTEYNDQGKVTLSRNAAGVATRRFYNSFGSQIMVVENADAGVSAQRRTAYLYDSQNRLQKIANVRPSYGNIASDGSIAWTSAQIEVTELVYGADVAVPNGTVVSRNNSVVGQVKMPLLGGASAPVEYTFVYGVDGQLMQRADRRAVKLDYARDDLGRLASVSVKSRPRIPPWGKSPEDCGDTLEYTYDQQGRLSQASLSTSNGVSIATDVITTTFAYDSWSNLISETQSMGSGSAPRTYVTGYTWDFARDGLGNHNRLTGISYPAPPTSGNPFTQSALNVQIGYGAANSTTDQFGQIASISATSIGSLATYGWSGNGTRQDFSRTYGSGQLSQGHPCSTSGAPSLAGFDRFGREGVVEFKSGSTTVQKFAYSFDAVGNILAERVELAGHVNTLSQQVAYDALDRITGVQRGQINSSNQVVASVDLSTPRIEAWQLDLLGNWSGSGSTPGYSITGGGTTSVSYTHSTDPRNQIQSVTKVSGSTTTTKSIVYDRNGNLVSDGVRLYQYDAFNRLVQVNLLGEVTFDADGEIDNDHPGPWLVHYTYDALGRLARRQAPWVPISQGGGTYEDNEYLIRIEEYAYDGLRRLSEFFYDPTEVAIDPKGLNEDIEIPTSGSTPIAHVNRQYVYGPGDKHGLDEFVAEVDHLMQVRLLVQNQAGDVTGVLDRGGGVLGQRQFDSTGAALYNNDIYAWPLTRVGWQGLFADRLDGTVFSPTVAPGADTVYQVRNRTYRPEIGRFLQRDPNGGGQPTAASVAMMGTSPVWYAVSGLDSGAMYGDGMSLFAYGGGNSRKNRDPLGLYMDEGDYEWGDLYEDANEILGLLSPIPSPSDFVTGALRELVSEYSNRLSDDLDWAMDWSQPDDGHSRGENAWVYVALGRGLYHAFDIGIPFTDATLNPLDPFGGGALASSAGSGRGPGLRIPHPEIRIPGARLLAPLSKLSANDIRGIFKKLDLRCSNHFIERLRGLGAKADPRRMQRLGVRTIEDVQQILRYGTVTKQTERAIKAGIPANTLAITYRGVSIITDLRKKNLISIVPSVL